MADPVLAVLACLRPVGALAALMGPAFRRRDQSCNGPAGKHRGGPTFQLTSVARRAFCKLPCFLLAAEATATCTLCRKGRGGDRLFHLTNVQRTAQNFQSRRVGDGRIAWDDNSEATAKSVEVQDRLHKRYGIELGEDDPAETHFLGANIYTSPDRASASVRQRCETFSNNFTQAAQRV